MHHAGTFQADRVKSFHAPDGKAEAQRKEALIYLSAKEVCRRKGFWSPADSADILPLKQVQDFMRWLVKNDYLERIGYGKYVLSEKKLSGERGGENQADDGGAVQEHDRMV